MTSATPHSLPPHVQLINMMTGFWLTQAIYVAARLGLADQIQAGVRTAPDLAPRVGAHPGALYRLLRALANAGILAEDQSGAFSLTPVGACLRSDVPGSLEALARMTGEIDWEPWGHLLESVRTGRPAVDLVYGRSIFSYLEQHPDKQAVFNRAMSGMSEQTAQSVCASYDFAPFHTVVDVGGGQGSLLAGILRAHLQVHGILFDLPHVIDAAQAAIGRSGVGDRCQLMRGSFLEAVPAGGDLYVMAHIIHDWDDEHSIAILANCRRAMQPHSRLLLVESVIPPAGTPSFGKLMDLEMLALPGGRERTEPEYRELLRAAGLELTRVIPTPGMQSLVESVARG